MQTSQAVADELYRCIDATGLVEMDRNVFDVVRVCFCLYLSSCFTVFLADFAASGAQYKSTSYRRDSEVKCSFNNDKQTYLAQLISPQGAQRPQD